MKIFKRIKNKIIRVFNLKKKRIGKSKINYGDKANQLIKNYLSFEGPFLLSRLGTTESEILRWHLERPGEKYPERLIQNLSNLSGVFPESQKVAEDFCVSYRDAVLSVDVFAIRATTDEQYFWEDEEIIFNALASSKKFIDLNDLDPFQYDEAWTELLKNKKILIIHPFEKSIIKQYEIKDRLFKNKTLLPDFTLLTIKAVQSLADNKQICGYSSFFDALESMKSEIDKKDFDIALIGAGAYGMLLGQYCKTIGKKAIHVGGALQLYFGIHGKRWRDSAIIKKIANEHWVEPLLEEMPLGSVKVENGCYW